MGTSLRNNLYFVFLRFSSIESSLKLKTQKSKLIVNKKSDFYDLSKFKTGIDRHLGLKTSNTGNS